MFISGCDVTYAEATSSHSKLRKFIENATTQ